MKQFILALTIVFGLTHSILAQNGVITAVPCHQLGMVMNVGSNPNSISIYHSGQYMTHPQSENIFIWEFTDQEGNILHQDTLVDASTISFSHNWMSTDTINVTVHFLNDSAILNTGNSIDCLFEDQIYWDTSLNTPWGSWTFIHNNAGVSQNSPLITVTPCDSVDIVTNPNGNVSIESMSGWGNLLTPLYMVSSDPSGNIIGEDSLTFIHYAFPSMSPVLQLLDFTTCISYSDGLDTLECCIDFYWNGEAWLRSTSGTASIDNLSLKEANLLKVIDALGKDVEMNTKNRLLFYIYDNGKIEKKFIFE
jgi:hypothetical protein